MLKSGDGSAAVGSMGGVGDGDSADARVGQPFHVERLKRRVFAGEQNEGAAGVGRRRSLFGEAGGDDAFGEGEVGGEKEVDGGAVEDLRGESAGGSVAHDEFDAGGLPVELGKGREDWLEVSGSGDTEFFARGVLCWFLGQAVPRWHEEDREREQSSGNDWPRERHAVRWGEQ